MLRAGPGDRIVIIGNLGYPDERVLNKTPVYVLDLTSFSIAEMETSGAAPGWIHRHTAALSEDGSRIVDWDQQRSFAEALGEAGEQPDRLERVRWRQWQPHRPGAIARPCKRSGLVLDDGVDAGAKAPEATRDRDRAMVKGVRREA